MSCLAIYASEDIRAYFVYLQTHFNRKLFELYQHLLLARDGKSPAGRSAKVAESMLRTAQFMTAFLQQCLAMKRKVSALGRSTVRSKASWTWYPYADMLELRNALAVLEAMCQQYIRVVRKICEALQAKKRVRPQDAPLIIHSNYSSFSTIGFEGARRHFIPASLKLERDPIHSSLRSPPLCSSSSVHSRPPYTTHPARTKSPKDVSRLCGRRNCSRPGQGESSDGGQSAVSLESRICYNTISSAIDCSTAVGHSNKTRAGQIRGKNQKTARNQEDEAFAAKVRKLLHPSARVLSFSRFT